MGDHDTYVVSLVGKELMVFTSHLCPLKEHYSRVICAESASQGNSAQVLGATRLSHYIASSN